MNHYRSPDDPYASPPGAWVVVALGVAATIGGAAAICSSLPTAVVAVLVFVCTPLAGAGAIVACGCHDARARHREANRLARQAADVDQPFTRSEGDEARRLFVTRALDPHRTNHTE